MKYEINKSDVCISVKGSFNKVEWITINVENQIDVGFSMTVENEF